MESSDKMNRISKSRLGETSQLMSTSSNIESSVIQNTNKCTNAVGSCAGQSKNRAEELPERVSKLNRTNINDTTTQATQTHKNMNVLRTRDTLFYDVCEQQRVGNDRTHSTGTTMNMMKTETTVSGNRDARETQTTATATPTIPTTTTTMTTMTTNGSSVVNIGSSQMLFSRDRLFHASVSSTSHAFFDLFKFSRHSESNSRNLNRSNRETILQKNSCAVAAMRLNVPNQDSTAVAASEPSISVSTRINRIDNSKTIVNISNTQNGDDCCTFPLATMTTTTSTLSCPTSASHIFENGTLLGAIVTQAQPSLTIKVNQNEHHQSLQTQVIEAFEMNFLVFYARLFCFVFCMFFFYRIFLHFLVFNSGLIKSSKMPHNFPLIKYSHVHFSLFFMLGALIIFL